MTHDTNDAICTDCGVDYNLKPCCICNLLYCEDCCDWCCDEDDEAIGDWVCKDCQASQSESK